MAEKQSNRERLKEITDRIEAGIQEMFQSGNVQKYEAYLRTMGRFHRYSVNNIMLILMQRPDATLVAGYNKWQNQFGRHVMRGEKGITIIAPTPYKKKIEEEKLDPNTQKPMLDENGDVIMEEKEIRIPMFCPTTVFDVAQTEGKPLPERVANPVATLTGDVEHYEVFMEALRRSSPVPIRAGEMDADTDGYFSRTDQEIVYREGMSQIQTVSAVIHEIGHAKLHNYGVQQAQAAAEAGTELPKPKDRNTEEVEAESISCAVCAFFGIDTGANSFGYIASWSKDKKLPEFRASLDTISRAADSIITDVETHFAEICKERGIDLSEKTETHTLQEQNVITSEDGEPPATPVVERLVEEAAPETVPEIAPPPDPTMSIAAMNAFGYTDGDMLPLSKERALELMERDVTVYMLYENNAEAMAFEPEDIEMHTGIFGITREDWDAVRDTIPAMDASLVQQKQERAFLESTVDSFAIYQLKGGEERADYRFENSDYLRRHGITPARTDYDLVYTGELPPGESTMEKLESLYRTFNTDHPEDFRGHSLSVSDIVAIRQNGVVSCHYVDSVGYTELPGFLQPDNYLKNTEMQLEDDYGMIDGVINNGPRQPTVDELEQQAKSGTPISLLELSEAVHREKRQEQRAPGKAPEKRPSVIARLRAPLPAATNLVRDNAERDL